MQISFSIFQFPRIKHTMNSYNPSYSTTPKEFTYNSQRELIVNSLPNKKEKFQFKKS